MARIGFTVSKLGVSSINVIHIIWKPFGVDTFERFLRSYALHGSGRAHRLICVFKGFADREDAKEYKSLLGGIEHEALFVEDTGYDIGAYLRAAEAFPSDYYFFLNSKSVLLGDNWLEKMYSHASRDRIGLAGATASWESLYTDYLRNLGVKPPDVSFFRSLVRSSLINRARHLYYYPPFPNYHIRTNAFMIRREVLDRIRIAKIKTRVDTSRFENGRAGLTRQIFAMNLDALVVGRNGDGHSYKDWPASATFWQSKQENLLVADNQTEKYASSDASQRAMLAKAAWG
jgi:hypothetical protein